MLVLTDNQRVLLKNPFGVLVDDKQITAKEIGKIITKCRLLITVGDATTRHMAKLGIPVDIEIIDGKEKRTSCNISKTSTTTLISCNNKPGTISTESINAVRIAIGAPRPVRIMVYGEEDLFVLLACDVCPDGTFIAYGQPNAGMVIIRVDATVRDKTRNILESMVHKDDETVAE